MRKNISLIILVITVLFLPQLTQAAELVTNGGFETGNFSGWTATNPSSAWRLWTISGTGSGGDDNGADGWTIPDETIVPQGTKDAWHGVTAGANQSYTLTQDVALPAGVNIRMRWMDRYQMNYSQFCTTGCGTATYTVEILNTSNTVLQTLYTVTTLTNTNTNTGWVNHIANLTAFRGTTVRLRFKTIVTQSLQGPGQLEIDAVSVQSLQPTSANVSVGGRVMTGFGYGIGNTIVTLTDSHGAVKTARTSPFGYYVFDGVEAGETCVVSVAAKGYSFTPPAQVITATDNLQELNFVADN
jgi:hypothetical protein